MSKGKQKRQPFRLPFLLHICKAFDCFCKIFDFLIIALSHGITDAVMDVTLQHHLSFLVQG